MDQTQQKALNALEPYLALAKSASAPKAATQVISQAISASNTFVFAELLQNPNIQALRNAATEQASYLTLLQIFSWGTWKDYKDTKDLPMLSDPQALKLRQLTLVSLARTPDLLSYEHLRKVLELPSSRALEDLVISAIYAGLLTAKLDTLAQRVDVSSVAPLRDVKPGTVPQMMAIFDDWDARCASVLAGLETQVKEVRTKALKKRRRDDANEKAVAKLMDDNDGGKGKAVGKRGVGDETDEMDVDETGLGLRSKNAKRGGGMFKGFGKR